MRPSSSASTSLSQNAERALVSAFKAEDVPRDVSKVCGWSSLESIALNTCPGIQATRTKKKTRLTSVKIQATHARIVWRLRNCLNDCHFPDSHVILRPCIAIFTTK